ncbi:MAG: hypothetical protein KA885_08105 [Spirochaetes bacterium]|nr:hypothetical protein [Spirochaetota bacterium]
MFKTVIMTGGISLFAQNNIIGKFLRENNIVDFERTNPVLKENQDREKIIKDIVGKCAPKFCESVNNPKNVSAEYSMLMAIKNSLDKEIEVILFYSDTFGGALSYELISRIIKNDFNAEIIGYMIDELDLNNAHQANKSISIFMKKLGKELETRIGLNSVCFAPIGGYKVMTSFGYIAGAFFGFPTYYLHEDSQYLHKIPPVPIKIDDKTIEENNDFLRKIIRNEVIDISLIDEKEVKFIEINRFLFEVEDNLCSLNAFGMFIINKHEDLFYPKEIFSNEARILYNKVEKSQKTIIDDNIYYLKELITKQPNDSALNHTIKTLNMSQYKYKIFKPNQRGKVFRATYKYDEEKFELEIKYFWLDHNLYEREIETGKGLK